MPSRRWIAVAAVAVGVALQVGQAVASASSAPEGAALSFVQAGADGPSAAVVAADFPDARPLPAGVGHDGQQNYAIARNPWHPTEVAPHLDRPRYRLQRPLLPVLAWALHPGGGGPGLVWALVSVNVAALALLGVAVARLAGRFGAPAWLPLLVLLLPLAYYPLRISVSDTLALGLVLWAVADHLDGRPWRATAGGVAAVLAKESSLVVLAGLWLARRDRRSLPVLALVALPAAVIAGLAVALRVVVDASGPSVVELGLPFRGLWDSFDLYWAHGDHLPAAVSVVAGLLLGAAVLASPAGRRHPLAVPLALTLAFTTLLGSDVLGLTANGTRTTAPLQVLALVVATSASVRRPDPAPDASRVCTERAPRAM